MPLPTKLMTIGAKGAKTGAKAATKTDQEALVDAAKAADRAAAGKRAADVAKATAPMKMSEALGNLNVEGKGKLKVTQSDRTRVGGGNIGGAMFPGLSQVDPFYEGLVWGVGKKGTASSLINQSDPNTIWTTILGKEDQLKSNPLVFNRLYDAFKREAKAGLLDDELRQKINAGLEPEFGKGADILDPKLRQKINTFDKRVLVADLLLGKGIGGEQRGGSIIPGSAILRQETEPLLLHTKQGGDVPTFAVGPRLFSLSGEVKERPDLHPGFPYLLTGEDTGMVFKPVPGEEAMIDFMTRMQEAGKKPGYYEWTMGEAGRGLPSQDINEAYLTYLQKKGYADGGSISEPGSSDYGASADPLQYKDPQEIERQMRENASNARLGALNEELQSKIEMYRRGLLSAKDMQEFFPGYSDFDLAGMFGMTDEDLPKNPEISRRRLTPEFLANALSFEEQLKKELEEEARKSRRNSFLPKYQDSLAEGGSVGSPGGIPEIAQELEAELRQYQVGGAIRRAAQTGAKAGAKSARQEALNMAREMAKNSFTRESQEKGVVYHGTDKDITKFRRTLTPDDHVRGISVTDDPAEASSYAESKAKKGTGEGANVLPLLVDVQKPMPYPDLEAWTLNKAIEKGFPVQDPSDFAAFDVPPDTLLSWLKEEGYDAIDYRSDPMLGYGLRVFEPTQLKSAIGNRTYDPRNPDITKAEGGEVSKDQSVVEQAMRNIAPRNLEDEFRLFIQGGGSSDQYGAGFGGRLTGRKKIDKDLEAGLYVEGFGVKPKGGKFTGDVTGYGVNITKRFAAGGAAKMKLRKKTDQPAEETGTPRPQLPQFGAGAPQEPSFTPEDPVQQMTVGSTNIPGQGGKFSKEDLADAFERFKVLGGDYLRRGGPRGLPIDLALHLFGGKLPADVRELFGEGVPPESSFNPDELIEIEQKANGGPVHMQVGGQPPMDEIGYMMEAVDPTKESKGSPTFEAVKFMAPQVAKSLVSPFVGIYGTLTSGKYGTPEGIRAGEEAIERFMMPGEVNLSPEAQEKIEDFANLMGKIETTGKLPPMMPELFGPVTGAMQGMGTQAKSLAGQAAKRVSQAVDEVPSLPVGLSIEPVGKPISEAIKPGKVKVEADPLGFYSPIEKALANSPRKQGTGQAFINDITKFSPSKGELEATGIFDWLRDQKSVTKQDVLNYIDQNRVQIEEVVRGTILDDVDRQKMNDINRRISRGFQEMVTPEEEEWFDATKARLAEFKEPKFEREELVLPGGKNYREILLKLPISKSDNLLQLENRAYDLSKQVTDLREQYRILAEIDPKSVETFNTFQQLKQLTKEKEKADFDFREARAEEAGKNYESTHWPGDPNTLAHMRMQDMTLGGKKTLVIEEIQSDWHQQGREKGYMVPPKVDLYKPKKLETNYSDFFDRGEVRGDDDRLVGQINKTKNNKFDAEIILQQNQGHNLGQFNTKEEAFDAIKNTKLYVHRKAGEFGMGEYDAFFLNKEDALKSSKMSGVPDAPFKKDWYQLAIKRLMKYAADNDYDQVALVGPEEQIRRGSLSTYIDGLYYKKNPDGSIKLEAEKGGSVVLDKTVDPKDLELYVNKDVAEKILNSKEGDGTLTGDDLEIGGEGMRQYYDRNYPDSMNRIGKKYGAKVNKTNFVLKEFEPDDVEEVYTGEFDRYGREIMAYKVVDRETGKEIAFEYDFDKVLDEANKKAPSTSMWVMDLPATLKSDVKVGQPYKKGGAVKKRNGGPIAAPFNTVPDRTDAGQILDFGLQQELNRYA